MLAITPVERRALRAQAHALSPVVIISQNGLSDSVMKEIDTSLKHHELIKIRVFSDERSVREEYLATICETLDAAPVQHIGKLLVIWRPTPDSEARNNQKHRKPKEIRRTKRSFQGEA